MNIHQFLKQTHIKISNAEKEKLPSHTSIAGGKYQIGEENLEKFWTIYCDQCHDVRLCITERPEHIMPVLCDVDIKQELSVDASDEDHFTRLYTDEMVLSLIQVYHSVLFEITRDLKQEDFLCCVLEKDPYICQKNGKTYKKSGVHLHFPRIFLPRYVQEKELIPRIVQEVKKRNISKTFAFEKCIDASYCKGNGWLLYGSSKSPDPDAPEYHPYEISYCVNDNFERINYRTALEPYNIYNIHQEKINFTADEVDYYLPRIFSISLFNRKEYVYHPKEDLIPVDNLSVNKKLRTLPANTSETSSNIELIDQLLELLSIHRTEDRNEWIMVGWILFNVLEGSQDGFRLWCRFSQKCPDKFDHKTCCYEWNRMEKRDMTVGSLKYMAKIDSPERYSGLMTEFMKPHLTRSMDLNGSHNDIAQALYQKYDSDYVCSSIQFKTWFQFDDHIWKKLEEGITLRQKLSDEVVQVYLEMKTILDGDYKKYNKQDNSRELVEKTQSQIKLVMSMIQKLKNSMFKNNVMRECMEVFYNGSFLKKLDANQYLIAFQNGVYDLQNHQFRDGRPSDFISLKMPITYKPDFSLSHPDVIAVNDFFVKIFPDKTLRQYFLNLSSEIFIGGNQSKIFQIWTGEGDNGKSITQILFEKMLGPYSIKLPTSLITGKRTQSSSACPELVRAGNGVRMATLQEPDQRDIINIGILKELSGNDTFFARGLYKEGQEITPMFKLILICNEPPKLPYNDKATWNRIRVIPFESTFTDEAPESLEEQLLQKKFPKDKDFADKIPNMVEAFAWLLLNTLKYKKKILTEPQKVIFATNKYRNKNDLYRQFMDEYITEEPDSIVDLTNLYATFKQWFRDSMPDQGGIPAKQELKDYFIKIWGNPFKKIYWKGFSLRDMFASPDDDDNNSISHASDITEVMNRI
jgi:P4 family phage/plasmid primase-like protien